MATIGSIVVRFGADMADFTSDMNRATKLTQKSGDDMKKAMVAAGAAIGTAMAGAGIAVTKMVMDTVEQADRFQKLTDRIGGSTEAFSQLEYVAERSGVKFETLTMGLQRMTRRIGEVAFAGKGEAKDALRELGLEAEALANLPLDKQFEEIADALSQVENKSDQTRLAMKLFDSEGVALVQTMGNGAEGIRALREEADQLGLTISSNTAASAVHLTDQITRLQGFVKGFTIQLSSVLLPTLVDLSKKFVTVGDGSNYAAEAGEFLANVLKVVVTGAIVLKNAFEAAAHVVVGLGVAIIEAFKGINDALNTFLQPAIGALKAISEGDFKAALAAAKSFGRGFSAELTQAGNKIARVLTDQIGEAIGDVTEGVENVQRVWEENVDHLERDVIPAYEDTTDVIDDVTAAGAELAVVQDDVNDALAAAEDPALELVEVLGEMREGYEAVSPAAMEAAADAARAAREMAEESEEALDGMAENIGTTIQRMFDDISRNGKLTFNGLLTVFASIADEIAKIAKDTDISFIGKENSIFGDGSLGGFFGSTGGQSVLAAGAGMAANLIVSEFGDEFATNYAEIGSQIGSVIGAIVGSFIPVIGTMLGGALGALAGAIDGTIFGKLFGRDLEVEIGGSGARGADPHDQILHTALGDIYSLRAQGGWGSFFEEGTPGFAMAESLRAFDEAIASLLNNDQLEMVVESLKTWQIEMRKDGVSIETLLNSRFSHILGNFNGLIADYVDGFEHLEDKMEAFGLALASFNLLTAAMEQFINTDPAQAVSDQLREMSKSSTEVLAGFGDALRGLMENFEGTPEQMQYIAAAIDARYQAEIDYLLAIERLVVSLMQSIQSQQERIGDAIDREVNGARTFEDLFAEATSMMDMLASAESPEQIEEIVSAIQKLVDAAFQALDPSQLVSGGEQLIAFLDEVLALATQRADELRQDAIDESDALRNEVADFAEAFGIPLETTNEAINGVSSEIQVQTEILVGESREQQNLQAQTNQLLADVRDALNQLEGSTGRLAFVPA